MNKVTRDVLNARRVTQEVITPEKFIGLTPTEKSSIKDARISPPKLGQSGFGGILVKYKVPVYKVG